jgi:hypothetical protein
MAALIEEEGLYEDGFPEKHQSAHCQCKCKFKQVKKVVQGEDEDDDEDSVFLSSGSESNLNGSDSMIPNEPSPLLFILCLSCFSDC